MVKNIHLMECSLSYNWENTLKKYRAPRKIFVNEKTAVAGKWWLGLAQLWRILFGDFVLLYCRFIWWFSGNGSDLQVDRGTTACICLNRIKMNACEGTGVFTGASKSLTSPSTKTGELIGWFLHAKQKVVWQDDSKSLELRLCGIKWSIILNEPLALRSSYFGSFFCEPGILNYIWQTIFYLRSVNIFSNKKGSLPF